MKLNLRSKTGDRFASNVKDAYGTVTHLLRLPFVLISVIWVVLYLVMFDYIRKLEQTGCVCSKDWRRTYIFWYLVIAIVLLVSQMAVAAFGDMFLLSKIVGFGAGSILFFIATVVFVVASLQYVHRLKVEKCKCSEASGRSVLQIVSWYHIITWAIVMLLGLYALVMGISVASALSK
jgi:hypothetical protein